MRVQNLGRSFPHRSFNRRSLLVLGVVVVGLRGVAKGRQLRPEEAGQDHPVVQVVASWWGWRARLILRGLKTHSSSLLDRLTSLPQPDWHPGRGWRRVGTRPPGQVVGERPLLAGGRGRGRHDDHEQKDKCGESSSKHLAWTKLS